jgi:hypothetical protein
MHLMFFHRNKLAWRALLVAGLSLSLSVPAAAMRLCCCGESCPTRTATAAQANCHHCRSNADATDEPGGACCTISENHAAANVGIQESEFRASCCCADRKLHPRAPAVSSSRLDPPLELRAAISRPSLSTVQPAEACRGGVARLWKYAHPPAGPPLQILLCVWRD